VGVGVKWNIFDGGQSCRDRQKAKLDGEIARNNYNNTVSLLNLNLERAQTDVEVAAQLIVVAQKRKATANKNLEICTKQYRLGISNITERLAAETDVQSAQLGLYQAIYNQRRAALNLLEATGDLKVENIK